MPAGLPLDINLDNIRAGRDVVVIVDAPKTRPVAATFISVDAGTPSVSQHLAHTHGVFARTRRQLGLLTQYKQLHDVLQELEMPFNAIDLSPANVRGELRLQIAEMQMFSEKTLALVRIEPLTSEFASCRQWLQDANVLLDRALNGDHSALDLAIARIRRVLTLDMSSANTRLVNTAQELGLEDTIHALLSLTGDGPVPNGDSDPLVFLRSLITTIRELRTAVTSLVWQHNQLQGIRNDLVRFIERGADGVKELEQAWPLVKASLEEVLRSSSELDWTRALQAVEELDAALHNGADAHKCTDGIFNLYRRTNQRFVGVDKQLLAKCHELREVGTALQLFPGQAA